ncbi:MAG: glycosyltransferase family 4 protein [Candidatus Cyclonatronum sp.]|nr:glycosyltransferase family 4 protein [Cyclonatronum sp.]
MKRRGHEVSALVPAYDFMPEIEVLGIPYRKISMSRSSINPIQELQSRRELRRVIAELQPDLVFAYTIKPVVQGVSAARKAGVPKVFAMITGMGYLFTGESLRQRLLRQLAVRMYKAALKQCDGIFFQNPDDISLFCELGIVASGSPVHMTNGSGVSLSSFPRRPLPGEATGEVEGEAYRRGSEVQREGGRVLTFLMIARLLQDKGVAEFVEAARMLKATYGERVRFQVAGPYDPNLPHAVSREQYDSWLQSAEVHFAGHQADVLPWLAGCDVYVLPSYREGTPRSVLEAMATGRPIITTDAPGCRETVQHGRNGYLIPPRSTQPLADAMKRFLENPALIAQMGEESYRMVQEKYEVGKVNAGILEVMGLD